METQPIHPSAGRHPQGFALIVVMMLMALLLVIGLGLLSLSSVSIRTSRHGDQQAAANAHRAGAKSAEAKVLPVDPAPGKDDDDRQQKRKLDNGEQSALGHLAPFSLQGDDKQADIHQTKDKYTDPVIDRFPRDRIRDRLGCCHRHLHFRVLKMGGLYGRQGSAE